MKTVVLLGAGASYGSGYVIPHCPPLGNQLFTELEKMGGYCAALPAQIKQAFSTGFEQGMVRLYQESECETMPVQVELARYLSRFEPGALNEYERLIRALGLNAIYCSLNYDMLLECAASRLTVRVSYDPKEWARDCLKVLKIHGSINFWPDLGGAKLSNIRFISCGVDIDATVRPLTLSESRERSRQENSVAPSMSHYAPGKRVTVCPGFVREQQHHWNEAVRGASQIFIMGVRVLPHDGHIWDLLLGASAEIVYFGLANDYPEFRQWKKHRRSGDTHFIEADFARAVGLLEWRRLSYISPTRPLASRSAVNGARTLVATEDQSVCQPN